MLDCWFNLVAVTAVQVVHPSGVSKSVKTSDGWPLLKMARYKSCDRKMAGVRAPQPEAQTNIPHARWFLVARKGDL